VNIFILDTNPRLAAQYQCDKHVVKMVLESTQLLCSPFEAGTAPYKRTHYNHPAAIWTRQSLSNWKWLLEHAYALVDEYYFRYRPTDPDHPDAYSKHACEPYIDWCNTNYVKMNLPDLGLTPFVQCMPDIYKNPDPVQAYRNYYLGEKRTIAKWNKNREKPDWYNL